MSGAKKCVPHLQCARHAHDKQTQARASADARPTHAAQPKPPARPSSAARPATHAPVQPKRPPSPPPAYRPQPVPKVLQRKTTQGRTAVDTGAHAPRPAHSPARPSPPPVYRPEPKGVAQPKAAAGAQARPPRATPQMRTAPASAQTRPAAPSAAAPSRLARPSSVVQPMKRKRNEDDEVKYEKKKKYWEEQEDDQYNYLKTRHGKNKPPPTDPRQREPSPESNYHYEASQFFTDKGLFNLSDRYMDYIEEVSGKSIGMSSGRGEEDNYDTSYVDIPDTFRPSAPRAKALWNQVYAGLVQSSSKPKFQRIRCREKCGDFVYVDKSTKEEKGTSKRPPMCHIIPFNHIRWAAEWVHSNNTSPPLSTSNPYNGPNPKSYPADTWKDLVWDITNLRPGHATCNSQTAYQARGTPSQSEQTKAINYVVKKLRILEPTWF